MKKNLLLTLFGVILLGNLNAQKLDFSVKADSVYTSNGKVYSITIVITKGYAPFSIYLCDKEPWLGGKIIEQYHKISSSTYKISNLTTIKKRLIMVKGVNDDEYNWKSIQVK